MLFSPQNHDNSSDIFLFFSPVYVIILPGGITMPYQEVSLDTKIAVVKDYFSGMKVTDIARKYNVSRDSVYTWKDNALAAIKQALKAYNSNEANRLKSELEKLKNKYQRLSEEYEQLSQESQISVSTDPDNETRPTQCPECSGNHIVKNGSYEVKEGINQRFRCETCNKEVYLLKKNDN